ncbi:hypothetical protein Glove_116g7 [Diversispora epigaea]|uniref:Uncharacterized protein n=1 Tax=Diversispora epigaea TaxID=1348612 RepID=A0A397J5C9_9GLOM|nr:hypothetical protein Glove_116g7 [Diversispora epigaea]
MRSDSVRFGSKTIGWTLESDRTAFHYGLNLGSTISSTIGLNLGSTVSSTIGSAIGSTIGSTTSSTVSLTISSTNSSLLLIVNLKNGTK